MIESGLLAGCQADTSFSMGENAEGLSVVIHDTWVIVHGGWSADKLWILSLPTLEWSEVVSKGSVPQARLFHSTVLFAGHLCLCGGTLLANQQAPPSPQLQYYELSLDTFEWSHVLCSGDVPTNRSHHTAVVCKDNLVVWGGKPCSSEQLTNGSLSHYLRGRFFDVYVLNMISRAWRRVEQRTPSPLMLWGHSASLFRGMFMLVYGGFEIESPVGNEISAPASVSLNGQIKVLNIETFVWGDTSVTPGMEVPPPRALCNMLVCEQRMVIFGGIGFDFHGNPKIHWDCWSWAIDNGNWERLAFCLEQWKCPRLISAQYFDQLVVINDLNTVHSLNLREWPSLRWESNQCAMASNRWVKISPFSDANLAAHRPLPPSIQRIHVAATRGEDIMAIVKAGETAIPPPTSTPPTATVVEVEMLKQELERLRSLINSVQKTPSAQRRTGSESVSPRIGGVIASLYERDHCSPELAKPIPSSLRDLAAEAGDKGQDEQAFWRLKDEARALQRQRKEKMRKLERNMTQLKFSSVPLPEPSTVPSRRPRSTLLNEEPEPLLPSDVRYRR